jgi:hypothetical protein
LFLHLFYLLILELHLLLHERLFPSKLQLLLHRFILCLAELALRHFEFLAHGLLLPLRGLPEHLHLLLLPLDVVSESLDLKLQLGQGPVFIQRVLLETVDLRVVLMALRLEGLDLTLEGRVARGFRGFGAVTGVTDLAFKGF